MANEQAAAPAKRTRKASGPRQAKPLYGLVSYTDENGAAVRLDKQRLNLVVERDMAKIVDALENGDGTQTVIRIELPAATPRAASPVAAS